MSWQWVPRPRPARNRDRVVWPEADTSRQVNGPLPALTPPTGHGGHPDMDEIIADRAARLRDGDP